MKKKTVKEYKREAREKLCGRYGLLVGAQILSGVFVYGLALLAAAFLLIGIGGAIGLRQTAQGGGIWDAGDLAVNLPASAATAFGAGFAIAFTVLLLLALLVGFFLMIGMQKLWLNICRGQRYGMGDLFYGFRKGSHPLRYLGVCVLEVLIILAAYLLFLIGLLAALIGMPDTPAQAAFILIFVLIWLFLFCYVLFGISFAGMFVIDQPETRVLQAFGRSWRMMKGRKLQFLWLSFSFILWSIPEYLSAGLASLWIDPYIGFAQIGFYLDALSVGETEGDSRQSGDTWNEDEAARAADAVQETGTAKAEAPKETDAARETEPPEKADAAQEAETMTDNREDRTI